MRVKVVLLTLGILLTSVPVVNQQERSTGLQEGRNGRRNDGEREIELNRHERAMTVSIMVTGSDFDRPETRFSVSDRVIVRIFITNTGDEPVSVIIGDPRIQIRPRLFRDGRRVPYKQELLRLLRQRDLQGPGSGRRTSTTIEPNQRVSIDFFDLSEWYETLEPGQYELSVSYRFQWRKRPAPTETMMFEVIP